MVYQIRKEYNVIKIKNWQARWYVLTKSWYEYKNITNEKVLDFINKDWKWKN